MSLGQELAPHLPFLRRYARALTGSQSTGDALVRATLERIVRDPDSFPRQIDSRLALYKTFETIASEPISPLDDETRLRPEFVEQVLDAVEAGQVETARQLVQPLHPADVADLIELAARDEREGLVKALAGIVSPDVLAEMNDYAREDLLNQLEPEYSDGEGIPSRHWRRLNEQSRKALLLSSLEGFSAEDVGYLLGISAADVDLLVAGALAEIEEQSRTKVLIIEPSPVVADDLKTIVSDLGHDVAAIARTRRQAVAIAKTENPGLILSEVRLADGSSGIDAVRDILATASVPVVFITSTPEALIVSDRPEPAFLITKPYERSTVKSAIAQALFFDGPLNSQLPPQHQDEIATTPTLKTVRPALRSKPAPVDAVVVRGQLQLAQGNVPGSVLAREPLEALRSDFCDDVERLLQLSTNIGPAFATRLGRLRSLLEEPLSEVVTLRIANQTEALAEFKVAVEESLNPSDAADVLATIASLRSFIRQFPIWKAFQLEAAEAPPLLPEVEQALREVSEVIERQPDAIVDPELKAALSEVRETSEESGSPQAGFAFVRGLSNVAKAIARYALDRMKGVGSEFNKAIDKEMGKGLAMTASNILIAASTPLLALALHMPSEFSWVGPVIAIVRQAQGNR